MRAIAAICDAKTRRKKNSASNYINSRVRYESIISAVHQIEQSTQLVVCARNPNIYFDFCIYIITRLPTYIYITVIRRVFRNLPYSTQIQPCGKSCVWWQSRRWSDPLASGHRWVADELVMNRIYNNNRFSFRRYFAVFIDTVCVCVCVFKVLITVNHSSDDGKPGDLSQSAFADYVNWWQNIIGIINHQEEPAAEPPITPIDQSTCAPCSKY